MAGFCFCIYKTQQDSNLQPFDPESNALSSWAMHHITVIVSLVRCTATFAPISFEDQNTIHLYSFRFCYLLWGTSGVLGISAVFPWYCPPALILQIFGLTNYTLYNSNSALLVYAAWSTTDQVGVFDYYTPYISYQRNNINAYMYASLTECPRLRLGFILRGNTVLVYTDLTKLRGGL